MQWSVVLEAVGDREVTLEEVVELADAVARHGGVASGVGTPSYAARILVEAESREQAAEAGAATLAEAARTAGLPAWPVTVLDVVSPDDEDEDEMIRLGSLAGYPFEGPRLLAGWTPPATAAVYVVLCRLDPEHQPRPLRRRLRRPRRRPDHARLPVPAPAGRLLGTPCRRPLEGPRRDLRGPGRAPLPPRADRPGADRGLQAGLQRAPGRPLVEAASGSASTPRPRPGR